MLQLPSAFLALASFSQFILWTTAQRDGKLVKLPVDYRSASIADAHNPEIWLDANTAIDMAKAYGPDYGVGFVFTANDPFYFVDLDHCLNSDNTWSNVANDIMGRLNGAAVEISQSGTGLHIIGKGQCPEHSTRNQPMGLEFYTEKRFVALTGTGIVGDSGFDNTLAMPQLVADYFAPRTGGSSGIDGWTDAPVEGWTGPEDDNELIAKAKASKSAASLFGNSASFADLWDANEDALAIAYPENDPTKARRYNESHADMALTQHLAFWTGNNCDRMLRLMWLSNLVREKWNRADYLPMTIQNSVKMQETVYSVKPDDEAIDDPIAVQFNAPKFKGSKKQVNYAIEIRCAKLAECLGDEDLIEKLCVKHGPTSSASFWIDNKNSTIEQIVEACAPLENVPTAMEVTNEPTLKEGYQFLGVPQQLEYFRGCVYLQDQHVVFTPKGALLKQDRFNATYGGYAFQIEAGGNGRTTKKPWEAFTESQAIRFPKAERMCFDPLKQSGEVFELDLETFCNVYVPLKTPSEPGDATPFLTHLTKVLPDQNDQAILLSYMAACVQYQGHKFQWCPLLQGVEGNGKTLFTRAVRAAVGHRYTHMPKASKIDSEFNDWLRNKVFIGVEDIHIPDSRRDVIETLKPMITGGDGIETQKKGVDQVTSNICANFMLNSNHKTGLRKTRNDRRFCMFYTAQQDKTDIERDGMGGDYFTELYRWLREGGYAIVTHFLQNYQIPVELNPAVEAGGKAKTAPITSSTEEAIAISLGSVEQEIMEAIEQDKQGFAGGWVSSMALDRLLQNLHLGRAIPPNRRREMLQSMGYDWHPALRGGRVNGHMTSEGGKPKLFIKDDHISKQLNSCAAVVEAYEKAQALTIAGDTTAAEMFEKG